MVLSLLLEHGALIDGLDNLRRAPLHWAVIEKAVSNRLLHKTIFVYDGQDLLKL